MKRNIAKLISAFLVLVIVFNIVACSSKKDKKDDEEVTITLVGADNADGPYSSDDLKTITIKDLNVNEINVISIDPKDVVVNSINVKEIESIEMQVIPLNDQMVTLAYENFQSVYGDDIDIGKLIANVAVGAVCVVVYVGLTYVGGVVGNFFGTVIVEELAALSVVIGAAIDAAISGFQAYQEGGDASYIIGHMVNGVAEGFMWSAILAPLTVAASQGIKGIRAIKKLCKIPDFAKLSEKEALNVLKNLPDFLREAGNITSDQADEAIEKLYEKLSEELKEKITKDVFVAMVKNKNTLISIARDINPMGLSGKVAEALRDSFWKNFDNISDDAVKASIKDTIQKIQNGTITNLDDITNKEIKDYIIQNSVYFIQTHSDKLTNEFVENWLKSGIGDDAFNVFKKNISTTNGLIQISRELGNVKITKILENSENYELLIKRFGKENIEKLRDVSLLYRYITDQSTALSDDFVDEILDKMFQDGLDLSTFDNPEVKTITANLKKYSESVSRSLKNLGLDYKNKKLLNDLAINSLSFIDGISTEMAEDIILSGMDKRAIIAKYGEDVWKLLTKNGYSSITRFSIASDVNMTLIKDIAYDVLANEGYSSDVIDSI